MNSRIDQGRASHSVIDGFFSSVEMWRYVPGIDFGSVKIYFVLRSNIIQYVKAINPCQHMRSMNNNRCTEALQQCQEAPPAVLYRTAPTASDMYVQL